MSQRAAAETSKSELIEVSYLIIDSKDKDSIAETLESFATSINVQYKEDGIELPYVPFPNFEKANAATKLILYGPSGCGKSKTIFEIIRRRIPNLSRIIVINPRQIVGERSGRMNLAELLRSIDKEKDAVVWDNFPDDLIRRDVKSALYVLEMISSLELTHLLLALKPKYLELYSNIVQSIPEFEPIQIGYDLGTFRNILRSLGLETNRYTDAHYKYVNNDLERISRILWQKEPLPLTILDYYRVLSAPGSDQYNETAVSSHIGISVAEKLPRRTAYYEEQFKFISFSDSRLASIEFLYTLKLCYDLGLARSPEALEKLQQGIFRSNPPREPLRELATWLYLSGVHYSMHDVCKDAITIPEDIRLKILRYLVDSFEIIVPSEESVIFSFGIFLGRNIQYVPKDASQPFLPDKIYSYMKKKRNFETGFGLGIAEAFLGLDENLQKEILKRVEVDIEFARGLADGLGHNFISLDQSAQHQILNRITSGLPFARFFVKAWAACLDRCLKIFRMKSFQELKAMSNSQMA